MAKTPKSEYHLQKYADYPKTGRKSVYVAPARVQSLLLARLLGIMLLVSAASLVSGGMWLSFKLFFDPDGVAFINNFLPKWAQIPLINPERQPQTLTAITASLMKLQQTPGELVPLEVDARTLQPQSVILPVRSLQPRCINNCNQIVELRVYQITTSGKNGEIYYQLITQIPVTGVEVANDNGDGERVLPLTAIRRFEGKTPAAGIWFNVWGEDNQGINAIAYGQIVHYNPDRTYLSLLLPWTSLTGKVPQWQQVINGSYPELVIDQTVDLEPQLQVYQVKAADNLLAPFRLSPISLEVPAINRRDYQNALLIARNGLWTPAWHWLESIKRQRQKQRQPWTAPAQAQIDFIRLHAQTSQVQANKTWASPSQQVLAYLIDGRWAQALQVFQASVVNTQEITTLLATDTDARLWNRVAVALAINSQTTEVKAWGALIKAAQQGSKSATTWLKQQPNTTPATVIKIQKLLKRLDGDFSTSQNAHHPRILGTVQPATNIDATQWLKPNNLPLELSNQYWYQIQLTRYDDGNRWQQPLNLQLPPAKFLWQHLGLNVDAQIELIAWLPNGQQQTISATVKAVRVHNGMQLLAVASTQLPSSSTPLAMTPKTLQWIQPQVIALTELTHQQQPIEVAAITANLWQELHKRSRRNEAPPRIEVMLQQLGQLPVRLVDLTGDNLSEVVVSIAKDNKTRTQTVVLSATGKVLYSEFRHLEFNMKAIAQLDDHPPGLLIESGKKYVLKHWSNQHQQFN